MCPKETWAELSSMQTPEIHLVATGQACPAMMRRKEEKASTRLGLLPGGKPREGVKATIGTRGAGLALVQDQHLLHFHPPQLHAGPAAVVHQLQILRSTSLQPQPHQAICRTPEGGHFNGKIQLLDIIWSPVTTFASARYSATSPR